MITPADLARMLRHASATAAGERIPATGGPDRLLYTSQTRRTDGSDGVDGVGDADGAGCTDGSEAPEARPAPVGPADADTEDGQGGADSSAPAPAATDPAAPSPGMPTPADVARRRAAAQAPAPTAPQEGGPLRDDTPSPDDVADGAPVDDASDAIDAEDEALHGVTVIAAGGPPWPTPAMMPRRRTREGPSTFASLDAQELPVVREYSAGGLVFDEEGNVAIIARHSRSGHLEWCLPKGHIEKGETPSQTAVREVHEETGILGEVVDSIATIDYWFTGSTQRVHKLVHHFALRRIGGDLTVEGDPDHEAEDAIWVRFEDLDDVLSYPNERKIAWLYARKRNRQAHP